MCTKKLQSIGLETSLETLQLTHKVKEPIGLSLEPIEHPAKEERLFPSLDTA
jgi:hypothetical protein